MRLKYGFLICFMQWFSLGFVKRSKLKRSPINSCQEAGPDLDCVLVLQED